MESISSLLLDPMVLLTGAVCSLLLACISVVVSCLQPMLGTGPCLRGLLYKVNLLGFFEVCALDKCGIYFNSLRQLFWET